MSNTANAEYLRALVETALAERDLELFDLQMGGGTVRVLVDREGGVDLEEITAATQALNRILDESDPMPGRYTLEVSSPGIERQLRTPTHFRRAIGEIVRVRTRAEVEGDRRIEGELAAATDDYIEVAVKAARSEGAEVRRVPYDDIERARTVFDWDKAVALAARQDNSSPDDSSPDHQSPDERTEEERTGKGRA